MFWRALGTEVNQSASPYGRTLRVFATFVACLTPVVLGASGWALWLLWQAWHTGQASDWQAYWESVKIVRSVDLLWSFPLIFALATQQERLEVQAARRAAIDSDERVMPVAAEQPEPLAAGGLLAETTEFNSFANAPAGQHLLLKVAAVELIVFGAMLAVGAVGFGIWLGLNPPSDGSLLAIFVAVEALLVAVGILTPVAGIWMRRRVRRWSTGFQFVTDEAGVRWVSGASRRTRASIPWQEARAFWMVSSPSDMYSLARASYVVDSGTRMLSWSIPRVPTAEQLADHVRLSRLIVTRTGLPLRDCSAVVAALARASKEGRQAMRALAAGASAAVPGDFASAVLGIALPRSARWLSGVALVVLVLLGVLYGGGWVLQHIRL